MKKILLQALIPSGRLVPRICSFVQVWALQPALSDIRAVVEDCRSRVCGGLKASIDIWELAVLPKLLFNSVTWLNISETTVQEGAGGPSTDIL